MAAHSLTFTFDGKERTIELTLGEVEILEDAFDLPVEQINFDRMKATVYTVAFALHRDQPRRDFDSILNEVRDKGLDALVQPKPAPKARPTKLAAKTAAASA